jgi:UDP-glucose:(heptosyl)LPS alpha-1,3-glucosyltransferase
MHVALVHIKHAASGGVEAYLTNLARFLAQAGHTVSIICYAHAEPPHPAVRFVRLRPFNLGGAWKMWAFAKAVERHVAETHYDVVYGLGKTWSQDVIRLGGGCHQTYLDLAGDAERRFLHPPGGGWLKNRTALAIESRSLSAGAYRRVITNSEMVKRDVCARHKVPPDLVTVIHNGVDLERFHPRLRDSDGAALRRTCGFGPEHQVILFLGSGYARKGLDLVLDAFPAVLARRPGARLLVVGYDSAQAAYQARTQRAGVAQAVCFLGGRRDVPACYAAADLYVLPTRYDPFANSTIEALASGLPVITSDANGGAEVISEAQAGTIIPYAELSARFSAEMLAWTADERLRDGRAAARRCAMPHALVSKLQQAEAVLHGLSRAVAPAGATQGNMPGNTQGNGHPS